MVQAGDTLRSIAEQFATTVDSLMEANEIEDPDLIRTGLILTIPASTTAASDSAAASATTSPTPTSTPTPSPTPAPTPTPTSTPRLPIRVTLRDWGYEILELDWDPRVTIVGRVLELRAAIC